MKLSLLNFVLLGAAVAIPIADLDNRQTSTPGSVEPVPVASPPSATQPISGQGDSGNAVDHGKPHPGQGGGEHGGGKGKPEPGHGGHGGGKGKPHPGQGGHGGGKGKPHPGHGGHGGGKGQDVDEGSVPETQAE
ncbi:hypothetical protein N0V82_007995 [Gnomoniopsis sp. IMI 355080]|nr:hypothetical protein N0V82_007995 [Gnomoniopsis sp. IMI 355080]